MPMYIVNDIFIYGMRIKLGNNPWNCNNNFYHFIQTYSNIIQDKENITCYYGNSVIETLTLNFIHAVNDKIIIFSIALALFIILLTLYLYFKSKIKVLPEQNRSLCIAPNKVLNK